LGNGAFLAVLAVPRINNLLAINTLNSSTPAASTTIYIVINNLQETSLYVQAFPEEVGSSMVEIRASPVTGNEVLDRR
jgi:hypothetical protein